MSKTTTLDPMVLGRRLRFHRKKANLTLDELGERVGKPAPYLSLVENGKKEPRLGLVMEIASALSVDPAELLDLEPPTRRDALELEMLRFQETSLFEDLDLPSVKPGAKLDNTTLSYIVGLQRALRERSGLDSAGSDDVRRANAAVHALLGETKGYLPHVEEAAAAALRAAGHEGPVPFSSRNLLDLAAHLGYEIVSITDMPGFARSIIDTGSRRVYIAQRNELRTRQARKALIQTFGTFLLEHEPEPDLNTFLRQRMESAYFAAAVLIPEQAAVEHLRLAKQERDLDVEDLKELFYVSYEMAAWRMANLAHHHLGIACHMVVSDEVGTVIKGMVNDGAPVPRDEHGGIETQRLCRRWGSQMTFHSEDRFATHRQYTDTPTGTYFCTTHIEEGRVPVLAVTLGVPFDQAQWFRGRETSNRESSTCPDPSCCRTPPSELAERYEGSVIVHARSQQRILGLMAPDPFPEMDMSEVLRVVDRHSPTG
ncbi:MAG: helix-turn-helix domain-containing protein [Acidimicrobiales bacterium]|nr:helix-turn-helix domain-containing protein [Acidimicrobiales bacterium]